MLFYFFLVVKKMFSRKDAKAAKFLRYSFAFFAPLREIFITSILICRHLATATGAISIAYAQFF